MNPNEYKVVRFTNISDFDFTGELGARYGGRDFFVPAGKSKLFPFDLGDHLATHLARQILIKSAPVRDDNHEDGRGGESKRSDRHLFNEESIKLLKAKIIKEEYEEERQSPQSETDRLAAKVEDLNKFEKDNAAEGADVPSSPQGGNGDASTIVPMETTDNAIVYKDKAQVIAELTKQGKTFNPRSSKATLEEML